MPLKALLASEPIQTPIAAAIAHAQAVIHAQLPMVHRQNIAAYDSVWASLFAPVGIPPVKVATAITHADYTAAEAVAWLAAIGNLIHIVDPQSAINPIPAYTVNPVGQIALG